MKSMNELEIVFDEIKEKIDSLEKLKKIRKEFERKKIGYSVVSDIFSDNLPLDELNLYEQIALTKGIYNLGYEEFRPDKFFSDDELMKYELYTEKSAFTNILDFDEVSKYDDTVYYCTFWNPLDQIKARMNRNIGYDFNMQRDATYIKDNQGRIRKTITINRNAVEGIKNAIREGNYYPPDVISLAVVVIDNKEIMFEYSESHRHIQIECEPSMLSERTTKVVMSDGWHRDTALWELYKEGYDLSNFKGFPVQIAILTPAQISAYVVRQGLANKMSTSKAKTNVDNSYNSIINNLNTKQNKDKNSIFFNSIATTYEDMEYENKLMNYETLTRVFKAMEREYGIDLNSQISRMSFTKMLQEKVNLIVEMLRLEDKNLNIFKKYKNLINLFIIAAYKIKLSDENEFDLIANFVKRILECKDEFGSLRLNTKKFSIRGSIELVNRLVEEVEILC